MSQNEVPSNPENASQDARVTALRAQVAALRNRRRSGSDFVEWKPDVFYYLFALTAVALLAVLLGVSWSRPWTLVLAGLAVVAQFYVRPLANRLRYWALVRRPNRSLDRQIASLRAEIDRLSARTGE